MVTERSDRPRSDAHRSSRGGPCEDRDRLDAIFKEGRKARLDGKPLDDNPYAAGSDEREEWHAGWSASVDLDDESAADTGYQKN